jgi:hypothetical protein
MTEEAQDENARATGSVLDEVPRRRELLDIVERARGA